MIKRLKGFFEESVITKYPLIRKYFEGFESEIFRGIGTLAILNVIRQSGEDGIYGYKLIKEIKKRSESMLIIEEGTLYPMLRKLENWGSKDDEKLHIIHAIKKKVSGRTRKYYHLTAEGEIIANYLKGFFSRLIKSSINILELSMDLDSKQSMFCPNCANEVLFLPQPIVICEICGYSIELKEFLEETNDEHTH
jgi:PadR family transcriptional regulator, regulatory protein PadR